MARALASRLLALVAVLALTGCAALRDAARAEVPETTVSAPVAPPLDLQVQAPEPLKALLEAHLDLARLRVVAGSEPIDQSELARLIAVAPAQARALLETEGYFSAQVAIEQLGGAPPQVRLHVDPGAATRVAALTIEVQGALGDAKTAGDASAQGTIAAVNAGWPLTPGSHFRNPVWNSAKNAALARIRAAGYLSATLASSEALVDAPRHSVRLALVVDSGPVFRTGAIVIEGLQRQQAQPVLNLAGFGPGTPASEDLLLDYQERLQKSGLYDQVAVSIDADPAHAAAARVSVHLHEQPLQQATVGVGVSGDTGLRATLEHTHRRVFGQAASARNKFEVARLRQSWEGELSSHAQPGFYRNLIGGALMRQESDTDIVRSGRLRVGRAFDSEARDRLLFAEFERAIVASDSDRTQANALSLNLHAVWRRLDSVLLPTEGLSLSAQTALGAASGSTGKSPFGRVYGRLTAYHRFGQAWYAQARIELGQVVVRGSVDIPDTMRFRAGGDDSVRGYSYRSLGPEVAGVVQSGDVLGTASVELAHPVSARMPAVWWAVFADAGQAATRWSTLSPVLGVGLGLRWRSPVGPLRVDWAWAEETHKPRLHLGVGVTF